MIKKVKKRDGRILDFDKKKISNAILQAMEEVKHIDKRVASRIANDISKLSYNIIEIEEIQDIVEEKLMASSFKDVAKEYILYREKRNRIRNSNSKLTQAIKEKLEASDVQNQNANVDEHSFGGRMGEARNEVMKDYALNYLVSDMARENHLNNEIYIHDLDSYAVRYAQLFNRAF